MGKAVNAVGFAIGFDRTLEVAEMNNLISTPSTVTKVLVACPDGEEKSFSEALTITSQLRKENINTEIYLNPRDKLEKQLKYADKRGIPYVVIPNPNNIVLKNMRSGEQKEVNLNDVITTLK